MQMKLANIINSNLNHYEYGLLTTIQESELPNNKILYCKEILNCERYDNSLCGKFKAVLVFVGKTAQISNNRTIPILQIDKEIHFEEGKSIIKIDYKKSIVSQLAVINKGSIDLYLTGKCNQNCFACPSPETSRNDTEPKDEALRIASLLDGVNTHINVTGGEPTYYNDYFIDVIKTLQEKAPKSSIQVLTNAISFSNDKFVEKITKSDIKMDKILFSVAIYGSNNTIQDLAVGIKNSLPILDKALLNLINLKAMIELRVVITQYNYKDLENISDYIIKKYRGNILRVVFMGLEMSGNARKNQEKVWIDFENHNLYLENAILKLMNNGIRVRLYNYPLCYLKKNYWTLSKDSISYWKKKFMPDCNHCRVKAYCSGFFAATIPFIKKVYPIQGDK